MPHADPTPPIEPDRLLAALEAAGFTRYSETAGVYVRMNWPKGCAPTGSIVVPLDATSPGYAEKVSILLADLARVIASGEAARKAVAHLNGWKRSRNHQGAPEWATLTEITMRRAIIRERCPAITDAHLNTLTFTELEKLYWEATA